MSLAIPTAYVHLQLAIFDVVERKPTGTDPHATRLAGDRGQATTEYALVLLAAALVGLLVVAWATAGGGAERVARLFNKVLDAAIDRV